MKVQVEVQRDHLVRLAESKTAIQALAELIWNALDADASVVHVRLLQNRLNGLEEIQVSDNGSGMSREVALSAFEKLGNSWKSAPGARSPGGRMLHGSAGEGRYSAFTLGSSVRWHTRFRKGRALQKYTINSSRDDLQTFDVGELEKGSGATPGTDVIIRGIDKDPRGLLSESAPVRLAEIFALYLRQYPSTKIIFDGKGIDPSEVEEHVSDYELPELTAPDGRKIAGVVTVIEWKHKVERELHLCGGGGFSFQSLKPGIQAPGYNFTAYLQSDYIKECAGKGLLTVAELHPNLALLVDAGKDKLREHFRRRMAENARHVVEQWKTESIYPYQGKPKDLVEEAERQVFEVVALNVNEYLPDFATSDSKSKKFSLHMLKTAIERSPTEARRIVQEVLDLPKEKQEELVELLERTTLSSIINAAKLVVDRLDFLSGLEVVVFDAVAKEKVKERKHLHRILAENTWIFGEEFNLSVDDQGLTEVLKKHLHLLGKHHDDPSPVTTADGEHAIVDLMLSRRVPQSHPDQLEHLVIELKRPNVVIDDDVLSQVKKYAHAVSHDERFRDTRARWIFWALSNEIHEQVRWEVESQKDRPRGLVLSTDDPSTTIWVKSWGQVIQDCRARLQFYQKGLDLMAKQGAGLEYVQKMYSKYLPPELKKTG